MRDVICSYAMAFGSKQMIAVRAESRAKSEAVAERREALIRGELDEELGEAYVGEKEALMSGIRAEIVRHAPTMRGNVLEKTNPERLASILYLMSMGLSQTAINDRYGYHYTLVQRCVIDYADALGRWRELGGKLASKAYMQLTSLEEDLIELLREQVNDKEKPMKVSFKDLKELSLAKAAASREALTARGEASKITKELHIVTQADYEETAAAVRERLALREAEA